MCACSDQYIEAIFKMKDATVSKVDGVKCISSDKPPIYIEQREPSTFTPNEFESFDLVMDETPLLEYSTLKKHKANTTTFGHSLKVGGLLYLQSEGAKSTKERQALIEKIHSFYPSSHFAMIDTRRIVFNRQFLFMKYDETV